MIIEQNTPAIDVDFKWLAREQVIPWGINAINAQKLWPDVTGKGVKVAILDSGVDFLHPDFGPNIHKGLNVINPEQPPVDDNGHGTLVTGIIAAQNNHLGIVGVAPDSEIYPIKVLDKYGNGEIADITSGIEWCIENGIQIINMSFSIERDNPQFKHSIKKAIDSGIIVVASSKNSYGGTVGFPASYSSVISVTSVDWDQKIGKNAPRGKIDFSAPGVDIISTEKGGSYRLSSGNSLATPYVTGIIALVLEKPAKFGLVKSEKNRVEGVRRVLQTLAESLGEETVYGKGIVKLH
ncbi:S8 family peptidase [Brevibacillus agri]|uniref:S8 family peptidase n=1 Tax=Brevibacillus agri TaxID=51101 RepID=UPI0024BF3C42|nr:S8 family peptidase [Brevibacillus agri]WHX30764.1 S8 family peptidase [Brevibacillus agri]